MSDVRDAIGAADATTLPNPLDGALGLAGVRVHAVGQGDALSVLDQARRPVFHVDYGGRQSNPFKPKAQRVDLIDATLAVTSDQTLMLSHWDEDHWCSAREGTKVLSAAHWLVPRQLTSPRGVERSTKVTSIRCIPENLVGTALKFDAGNGDAVWFEKLGAFNQNATEEDCNTTGVAFAVTTADKEVILLPGDAPYHLVGHYRHFRRNGYKLRGLVAFHHGAHTHWTRATEELLRDWPLAKNGQVVVFSYGDPNAYNHPDRQKYKNLLPRAAVEDTPRGVFDLTF